MGIVDANGFIFRYKYEDCKIGNHTSVLTFNNSIENKVMKELWKIRHGDVVIDAGASFGLYTLPALVMGAEKVYAFEPHPAFAKSMRNNLKLNGVGNDKCEVIEMGLLDIDATVRFNLETLSMVEKPKEDTVKVMPLDSVAELADIERLDWIKIDVEGAEAQLLKGAAKTIEKFKPKLLIETHDMLVPNMTDIIIKWLSDRFKIQVETLNFERSYLFITFVS
jgi:FkbM family methyltransferase